MINQILTYTNQILDSKSSILTKNLKK